MGRFGIPGKPGGGLVGADAPADREVEHLAVNFRNWRKADKGFGNWEKDRKCTNCAGQRNHVFSSVLLVDFHRKVGSDVAGLAAEWQVRYNQRAANPKTLRNAIANFLSDLDTLERLGRT